MNDSEKKFWIFAIVGAIFLLLLGIGLFSLFIERTDYLDLLQTYLIGAYAGLVSAFMVVIFEKIIFKNDLQ